MFFGGQWDYESEVKFEKFYNICINGRLILLFFGGSSEYFSIF